MSLIPRSCPLPLQKTKHAEDGIFKKQGAVRKVLTVELGVGVTAYYANDCDADIPLWECLAQVPAVLLLLRLLLEYLGKGAKDGPRIWTPATHRRDQDAVLSSRLQPQMLYVIGK